MKFIHTLLLFFFMGMSAYSQSWTWGHIAASAPNNINPIYPKQVIAAYDNKALWCTILNKKHVGDAQYGDYQFAEYDTSGSLLNKITVIGQLAVMSVRSDGNGNWYVLARHEDTLYFPNSVSLGKTPNASGYCMFRLNAGTLDCSWVKPLGGDFQTSVSCFTIANNTIYLPIDSVEVTKICSINASNGERTNLWQQDGLSWTTSIQADNKGNIYLVGTCAFNGINFNGHNVSLPTTFQYPHYIVRYRANGTHHWSRFFQDGTCFTREFSLADDNTIYYTGPLTDTITLGNLFLSNPKNFASFLVAKMDSSGNCSWAKYLSDTVTGSAQLDRPRHAAVDPNGTLIIYASAQGIVDWGNGIITTGPTSLDFQGAVVAYDKTGTTTWLKEIKGDYIVPQQIAAANNSIWVTGNAFDSFAVQFDAINATVPSGSFQYYPYIGRLSNKSIINDVNEIAQKAIRLIPNPAKNTVKIVGSEKSVDVIIVDGLGRIVLQTKVKSNETIQIDHLPRGLYVALLNARGNRTAEMLLLQ